MNYAIYPKPVLGPCPCHDCGEPLYWARRNTRVLNVVMGSLRWRGWNGIIHRCPKAPKRTYVRSGRYTKRVGSSDNIANMQTTPFGSLTLSSGVAASRGQD
jgi:hypothetical protein